MKEKLKKTLLLFTGRFIGKTGVEKSYEKELRG
jgi:cell division protein FtsI/penicillin-binding protein 2